MKRLNIRRLRRRCFAMVRDLLDACWSGLQLVEGSAAGLARLQRPRRSDILTEKRRTRTALRRATVAQRAH